ncbi:MAG: sensor histidine kinase [Opitutales bacterium]
MLWLFFITALVAAAWLFRRLFRLKRLLAELEEATRKKRRLLPREREIELKRMGVSGLVRQLNESIDHYNRHEESKAGYAMQVEAMLRAVQEVVIVFNPERKVEFANRSAERLFRSGQSLKGLRLEGVMRSLSLLELLNSPFEAESAKPRQISIEHDHQLLWFEASCAQVSSLPDQTGSSTLLVLHDITQLKRLEMMRRDFVANVSHELRTPLTIIKGYAETLAEDGDKIKPEARNRFLGKILGNADRLNVLVEDLLTLSRLESKPDQLEYHLYSLREMLEDTIENYRERIDPARQKICLEYENGVGRFAFDRFRLSQVFDNLIENVFRYAPDFTKMEIGVRFDETRERVLCCIADDGPGIPEKDIPHIFERFYRVDKGRSRERGGTGLGLSIVKHIVQLHGGTLYAESGRQKGTKICFSLPYREQLEEKAGS